jgi:hypothetical protein
MQIIGGLFRPLCLGCSGLIALATLMSCKPAPMKNSIVARSASPDGKFSAILVDRFYQAALISDEFFLIVIPSGKDAETAINAQQIGDSSAVVATRADKVHLRWQDKDDLLLICDSCGIHAIDISKKLDHIGSTKIIYQGFPEHTAYSQD